MFRRAKICALLVVAGVLTAAAAPLDPGLKNAAFQPGGTAPIVAKATVIKPATTTTGGGFWSKFHLWRGAKVEKITPAPQPPVRVELNGFTFKKAPEAAVPPPAAQPAGGGR